MPTYALLGYPLSHSFSRRHFTEKFAEAGISATHHYVNFELSNINQLKEKLDEYSDLKGFNVTIPYKRAILPFLDDVDPVAARIGAVNTVAINNGRLIGYNTDYIGFRDDLLLQSGKQGRHDSFAGQSALVLGTGGASLGVREALNQLSIPFLLVSRSSALGQITYADITPAIVASHQLIVNTTPLGTFPDTDTFPAIPYHLLTADHFCYDLVYNPPVTAFMHKALGANAGAANGLGMLYGQAEAGWRIWNADVD